MAGKQRRAKGEGGIYKRQDGRYEGRYTVQTATRVKRKAVYGKTRADVATKLAKALAERENGLTFDAGKLTVGDYLTRWMTDSVQNSVRHQTFESYERLVRLHMKPALGHVKLKRLTPAHV